MEDQDVAEDVTRNRKTSVEAKRNCRIPKLRSSFVESCELKSMTNRRRGVDVEKANLFHLQQDANSRDEMLRNVETEMDNRG